MALTRTLIELPTSWRALDSSELISRRNLSYLVELSYIVDSPALRRRLRLAAPAAMVDDVIQEAFLRYHAALHTAEPIDNARRWLFTVAHNLLTDRLRQQRMHRERLRTLSSDASPFLPAAPLNPEQLLLQRRRLAAVRSALRLLTTLEGLCLHARAKGLTYKEIGALVGVDTSTAHRKVRDAIAAVRHHLRAERTRSLSW
jgi:RNA polymerase sigma factor (sigma-70 family)